MREFIEQSMSFDEYVKMLDELLAEGKTTGPVQSDEMFQFARLNRQRMSRLEKTLELEIEAERLIGQLEKGQVWLVITEGWCGDAAQNIPVIEKLAAANDHIETRYILRDQHPELIDQFLTNGTRSIPVLIAIDTATYNVLGRWSARPRKAQDYFTALKSQGLDKPAINEKLQRWYNDDKGRSLQLEIAELAQNWVGERSAASGK
ncbi:MAG TPA: thioredoxin family protein [Pyrinomonadaceae bacterium]|nr:thioredoxin family protein [Chloracidobacterium sp.]MBP9935595.1 thioredoxin family protein [Pyrinomonadaceae bacterium]MBK7802308.1 thioredoxin family protein [Chloracidobacterium sp.]MBK9437179.1 thioredoxin family protein [Chloracidobacterium sp.]MBK9765911.1 thioredoxin family protein [Chloracidobacterium sp.]